MKLFIWVLVSLSTVWARGMFRMMFREKYPAMIQNGVDPGQPLFLTPYLEQGKIEEARQFSQVGVLNGSHLKSYSGFFTVNQKYNSNMFFWFFPAQMDPMKAPVILWLQGGPGGSSMFGLFQENGPFSVDKDLHLTRRNITWNEKFSMLYIDNPVGTGFSFTQNDAGYAVDEEDVARDLYSCLLQFFQIFYEYQQLDFYITGESYAGKYVPAISYMIHKENPEAKMVINFKGMAIGDGLCDPETMMPQYADFLFSIGTLDENERDHFQNMSNLAASYIRQHRYMDAFHIFDVLMNGDLTKYPSFYYNVTGSNNYFNFLQTQQAPEYFGDYLAQPDIRRAIHVGNLTYNNGTIVEQHLLNDVMQTVKPWVSVLMDNYKVMMYSGQLDIIVATPLTEAFLMTVNWSGLQHYKKVDKTIWRINPKDVEVAGYVRQVGDFYQVVVRGAGHMVPSDQPGRAYDMIQRFVENRY